MSKDIDREAAKKHAQEAAKRLFGARTAEQDKALKDVKTIGSPDNLVASDDDCKDESDSK